MMLLNLLTINSQIRVCQSRRQRSHSSPVSSKGRNSHQGDSKKGRKSRGLL